MTKKNFFFLDFILKYKTPPKIFAPFFTYFQKNNFSNLELF